MASAKKHEHIIVTLELTEEEATCLRDVCARIGGPPEGRRGLMDNIGNALSVAGVQRSAQHWEPTDISQSMVIGLTREGGCHE